MYTSDFHFPGMLYAVPVEATIANGKSAKARHGAAEKMPGVRAIFHRENIGKIFRSTLQTGIRSGIVDERRPPFEDDVVRYYGQYIALAVADTFETAKGCRRCRARDLREGQAQRRSRSSSRTTSPTWLQTTFGPVKRLQSERGDPDSAFASAPVKLDQTYVTPAETHNPIELHATTAIWDGQMLTLYEESQGIFNLAACSRRCSACRRRTCASSRSSSARVSAANSGHGRIVRSPSAAARQLGKPVKLVLSRRMMFQTSAIARAPSSACASAPRPTASSSRSSTTIVNHHVDARRLSRRLRRGDGVPLQRAELRVHFGRARRNVGSPTPMRGPGAVPGSTRPSRR